MPNITLAVSAPGASNLRHRAVVSQHVFLPTKVSLQLPSTMITADESHYWSFNTLQGKPSLTRQNSSSDENRNAVSLRPVSSDDSRAVGTKSRWRGLSHYYNLNHTAEYLKASKIEPSAANRQRVRTVLPKSLEVAAGKSVTAKSVAAKMETKRRPMWSMKLAADRTNTGASTGKFQQQKVILQETQKNAPKIAKLRRIGSADSRVRFQVNRTIELAGKKRLSIKDSRNVPQSQSQKPLRRDGSPKALMNSASGSSGAKSLLSPTANRSPKLRGRRRSKSGNTNASEGSASPTSPCRDFTLARPSSGPFAFSLVLKQKRAVRRLRKKKPTSGGPSRTNSPTSPRHVCSDTAVHGESPAPKSRKRRRRKRKSSRTSFLDTLAAINERLKSLEGKTTAQESKFNHSQPSPEFGASSSPGLLQAGHPSSISALFEYKPKKMIGKPCLYTNSAKTHPLSTEQNPKARQSDQKETSPAKMKVESVGHKPADRAHSLQEASKKDPVASSKENALPSSTTNSAFSLPTRTPEKNSQAGSASSVGEKLKRRPSNLQRRHKIDHHPVFPGMHKKPKQIGKDVANASLITLPATESPRAKPQSSKVSSITSGDVEASSHPLGEHSGRSEPVAKLIQGGNNTLVPDVSPQKSDDGRKLSSDPAVSVALAAGHMSAVTSSRLRQTTAIYHPGLSPVPTMTRSSSNSFVRNKKKKKTKRSRRTHSPSKVNFKQANESWDREHKSATSLGISSQAATGLKRTPSIVDKTLKSKSPPKANDSSNSNSNSVLKHDVGSKAGKSTGGSKTPNTSLFKATKGPNHLTLTKVTHNRTNNLVTNRNKGAYTNMTKDANTNRKTGINKHKTNDTNINADANGDEDDDKVTAENSVVSGSNSRGRVAQGSELKSATPSSNKLPKLNVGSEGNGSGQTEEESTKEGDDDTTSLMKKKRKRKKKKSPTTQLPRRFSFRGYDGGKELAPHSMDDLPAYTDIAAMLLKRANKQREREAQLVRRSLVENIPVYQPREAATTGQYLAQHELYELFTDFTGIILNELPNRPIETILSSTNHLQKHAWSKSLRLDISPPPSAVPSKERQFQEICDRLSQKTRSSAASTKRASDLESVDKEEKVAETAASDADKEAVEDPENVLDKELGAATAGEDNKEAAEDLESGVDKETVEEMGHAKDASANACGLQEQN